MAVEKLRQVGALRIVLNLAVFNHATKFLRRHVNFTMAEMRQNSIELAKFRDGLDVLVKLWK